ncbi:B12-binding domain-containing radical SAM protein [Desulfovibrio inopinatus]|uniref:B12-binding domain-containing radical SAM protein n=1 Tax=Desulfovibrio inopinatus TaxID=102109 RepID=UPI00042651CB|nr:B12-binding domain-containing radical SAM protein [Desulfovibrio inopinatus]
MSALSLDPRRVLLIHPASPYSFWSFQETVRLSGRKAMAPPLGLVTVAALLPSNWDLRACDMNTRELREEDWQFADLVMITGMIVQREGMLSLIREAKRRGIPVAVGGPYATSVPQDILDAGCDYLIKGEAEDSIAGFLDALSRGETSGVFEESEKPNMGVSPIPRYDLLHLEDYDTVSIQTSRGCPFSCEFCDIINLFGRVPRYKSPDQVMAELNMLYLLGWRGSIFICDDNFIGNKKHARAILEKLIPWMAERDEPFSFFCQASVNLGQDKELIDLMTAANFGDVFVGVESPDENVLKVTNKQQNVHNPLEESLRNINANGLPVLGSFIIGFDGETKGMGERICAFVEKIGMPVIMVNMLQALPNTKLWDRLEREGRLTLDGDTCGVRGSAMNFQPSRPREEILEEFYKAIDRLYEPQAYLARAFRYTLEMRPTRKAMSPNGNPGRKTKNVTLPKGSVSRRLWEYMALIRVVWRQGVVAPYRGQFWRQLVQVRQKNPSRLVRYLSACAIGENLFQYRKNILQDRLNRANNQRVG